LRWQSALDTSNFNHMQPTCTQNAPKSQLLVSKLG
jgi:hypothetical protein